MKDDNKSTDMVKTILDLEELADQNVDVISTADTQRTTSKVFYL